MKPWMRYLYIGLACALLLAGCTKEEPPTPSGSLTGPRPASSAAESLPSDRPTMPELPSHPEDHTWSSYQWTQEGNVAARRHRHIDFIATDGRIISTFTPDFSSWPNAPDESIWGESFCDYIIGDSYVLVHFPFYGNPVLMQQGDMPTLVDAAIFDLEGNLIRLFPVGTGAGLTPIGSNDDFEASLTRRTHFYWVDSDLLAVSTGAQLWFYDTVADTLILKADYTAEVFAGWTAMESHGYGLTEDAAWAVNGTFYYALGEGYTTDISHNPRSSLHKVTWDSDPIRISGSDYYTAFEMSGTLLFAYIIEGRIEADGGHTPLFRFWQVSEEGTLTYVDTVAHYLKPVARQTVVGYCDTHATDLAYLHVGYELRAIDLATGERHTFSPTVANGGFPADIRLIDSFSLLDIIRTDEGVRLYYTFIDTTNERRGSGDFAYYVACYDSASGQTAFARLNTDILDVPPGDNPLGILLAIEPQSQAMQFAQLPIPN